MSSTFERFGVGVVALSKDTVAQGASHKRQDWLTATVLSDPMFKVIDTFGLRHRKGIEFWTFSLLGVPLGVPIGFKDMAVPTTLIIDERGIVRWIDQADDYRLRGDVKRIEEALSQVWPEG